jgi:ankyrin repeat protein
LKLLPPATYAERHAVNARSRAQYEDMLKATAEARGASSGLVADGGAGGIEPGSAAEAASFAQCATLLLRAGAAIDTVDADGRLPLHLAARKGNTPIVLSILDRAAEIERGLGESAPSHARRHRSRRSSLASIDGGGAAARAAAAAVEDPGARRVAGGVVAGSMVAARELPDGRSAKFNLAGGVLPTGVGLAMSSVRPKPQQQQTPPQGDQDGTSLASTGGAAAIELELEAPSANAAAAAGEKAAPAQRNAQSTGGSGNSSSLTGGAGASPSATATAVSPGRPQRHNSSVNRLFTPWMLNLRDNSGQTPLHHACRRGRTATVSALMRTGRCDALRRDYIDWTPIHWAAYAGHEACISVICSSLSDRAAAALALTDRRGDATPLYLAAARGHAGCVAVILRHDTTAGSGIVAPNSLGRWPEHAAAQEGHFAVLQALCQKNPRARRVDLRMQTPVHTAVANGRVQALHVLVHHGYSLNATDDAGRTPLHYAAGVASSACASILIGAGADVAARDASGRTALDIARRQGAQDIAAMLVQAGTLLATVASPGGSSGMCNLFAVVFLLEIFINKYTTDGTTGTRHIHICISASPALSRIVWRPAGR